MALGTALDVRWALSGVVDSAVIKQLGNVGVAWTTTWIAVYSLVIHEIGEDTHPVLTGPAVIFLIWLGLALLVVIPSRQYEDYYGPTGKWCWITAKWNTERIVTEYLWFWPHFQRSSYCSPTGTGYESSQQNKKKRKDDALVPVRFLQFNGTYIPTPATVFGASVLAMSGLLNVGLYFPNVSLGTDYKGSKHVFTPTQIDGYSWVTTGGCAERRNPSHLNPSTLASGSFNPSQQLTYEHEPDNKTSSSFRQTRYLDTIAQKSLKRVECKVALAPAGQVNLSNIFSSTWRETLNQAPIVVTYPGAAESRPAHVTG
ncbi:hypothetical protein BDV93DRAFT_514825 [Ceratobasidium sp. AG-I]|nr:hypothetical protein BDV93DRAFT_514825 [Ceratobasidium sp. AG-I]